METAKKMQTYGAPPEREISSHQEETTELR